METLGIGGWHDNAVDSKWGKDLTDIYKIGGDGGGWNYPDDGDGVYMYAEVNRIRAEYDFEVNDGPVKSVKYEVEYKDTTPLSDGPDALIYTWDTAWDIKSNIGGQGSYNPFYTVTMT